MWEGDDADDNETAGCQRHRYKREGTCVECYPDWMFERTGQFCLRHYLHFPNTICAKGLLCHVAMIVPPESITGYRVITNALRSLCLSIVHEGCSFSVRRWLRNYRTSYVARSIRYRGERFWRVYPDVLPGQEIAVTEEVRLKDWHQACSDFYGLVQDNGELGLLTPAQANPDPYDELMLPLFGEGDRDGVDDPEAKNEEGDREVPSSNGTTEPVLAHSPSASSFSSGASFTSTTSEILNRNFVHQQCSVPYRRMSWQ